MITMYENFENKIENSANFPVYCDLENFPDVMFHVFYETIPPKGLVKQTVTVLENFVYGYNKIHFINPIHYISDIDDAQPEDEHPFAVHIHIDFGNCWPKAIIKAVKVLDNSGLPIKKLVLE